MMKTLAKALAGAGIVGAVVLAPAPAFAYAPTPTPDSITASIGTPVNVVFEPIFEPGEDVDITLTGINGASQSLAAVGTVSSTSITKAADDQGSVEATVTFNNEAAGTYELTATGEFASDTVTITVSGTPDADGTAPGASGTAGGTSTELATTGTDAASLGLLVGGGALLLGGGAVLVSRSVRKQKTQA